MSASSPGTQTTSVSPTPAIRSFSLFPGVSFAVLATAAIVAIASDRTLDVVTIATALLLVAVWWARRRRLSPPGPTSTTEDEAEPRRIHRFVELALYLSPVLLLSIAYPLASHRLAHDRIDGVPLTTLLLASSVTVPWLTQAVCLPLYRSIATDIDSGNAESVRTRFCEVWPSAFLESLPTIAVFAVPIAIATGWSATVLGVYVALCVLYVAFAQSLILSIVSRNRVLWAVAWASLAATLLLVPDLWFLPPVVALATQVLPLRHRLHRMVRALSIQPVELAGDLLRGLLLGSVLWADKFLLFMTDGSHFHVTTVYLGLLPAILVYNYYFVRLAPRLDVSVGELRDAMELDSSETLTARSAAVAAYVGYSLNRTGVVGAVMVLGLSVVTAEVAPSSVGLIAAVAIASWFFVMTTLLCYKLDYIGQRKLAQGYSAAHLVACVVIFSLVAVGPVLYVWLIGIEAVIFCAALTSVRSHWRSSEYNLFWRHATAW
jgi:hypothetical protein